MVIKSLFEFGQARDEPTNKAEDAGYSFLFGRTTSGKPVNETTVIYQVLPQLIELWGLNVKTDVEAKKTSSNRA